MQRTLCSLIALLLASNAAAQQQLPHIGYAYPAGGRQGAEFDVVVGGQYLDGADKAFVTGQGVEVEVVSVYKPFTQGEFNRTRNKLGEARRKYQLEVDQLKKDGKKPPTGLLQKYIDDEGVTQEEIDKADEYRLRMRDTKRQLNPQIAEEVTLRVKIANNAAPGERELRMTSTRGLTNPIRFRIGRLPEHLEMEPNDKMVAEATPLTLPIMLNGQIMPGDVDRFSFRASEGDQLVIAASARTLIPYLADAVPGWFQATITLYDADGREVAFADDFRFHPDPLLFHEITADGVYTLEIRDAVYRGREDFVYRIAVGELPVVTGLFPLGGRLGEETAVQLEGWNLPKSRISLTGEKQGDLPIHVAAQQLAYDDPRFVVDQLPELVEAEPNDDTRSAIAIEMPVIVNGRIAFPSDADIFRLQGKAGQEIVAEVLARRLNSPLDSRLTLFDARGQQIATNDDYVDKGAGLTTHHADSRIQTTLPTDGTYYLRLQDTQGHGSPAHAYRLRVGPPRPDFELRIAPASINARAGQAVPISVFALRRDGFDGDIALELIDPPRGFRLSGAWIPAGHEEIAMTLTVPSTPSEELHTLRLRGRATIDGKEEVRPVRPAEDMMQAFIYQHLVPSEELMVAVVGKTGRAPMYLTDASPIEMPMGGDKEIVYSVAVKYPAAITKMLEQTKLALSDPPEGVTLGKVYAKKNGVAVTLHVDKDKIEPGLSGNLLIDAFIERKTNSGNRRFPIGSLPAIPFTIAEE